MSLGYSIVIATCERKEELRAMLSSVLTQTRLPEQTIIVDSSRDEKTRELVESFKPKLPILYERAEIPSAAQQRNQGALRATTPIVAFMDDDIILAQDTCANICEVFHRDTESKIGGIAARIDGMSHPTPKGLLWWYYRMQAGYADQTYGGKLFGPAINCLPTYTESKDDLVRSNWLNSTCVFYRREPFMREKFPQFAGYSFMEDVHLSARVGKTHQLYFHAKAHCEHRDAPSSWKRDAMAMARMRIRNQRLVAREIMGLTGPVCEWKLLLHRLFSSVSIVRQGGRNCLPALVGTWT